MNQFNTLRDDELTNPPRERNIQFPSVYFKSLTSSPQTNPVGSDITGRLNYHAVDNSDVEVHTSEYPFECTSGSIPYADTTMIKSIDDDEMDQLLGFFHSEYDGNLLDVDFHMLQA